MLLDEVSSDFSEIFLQLKFNSMKTPIYCLFALCLFFSSCSNSTIEPEELLGSWNLTNVYINGTDYSENHSSHILNFEMNGDYYRTYVTGTYNLDEKNLTLYPNDFIGIEDWEAKIVTLTDQQLVIKLQMTEQNYMAGFEEFADDEVLTIIERYVKN